jgi:hypothetical protein
MLALSIYVPQFDLKILPKFLTHPECMLNLSPALRKPKIEWTTSTEYHNKEKLTYSGLIDNNINI